MSRHKKIEFHNYSVSGGIRASIKLKAKEEREC